MNVSPSLKPSSIDDAVGGDAVYQVTCLFSNGATPISATRTSAMVQAVKLC